MKIIGLALFMALFFKSCFFDVFTIPSTSMASNLVPGDVIVVNKLRYGPKLFRTILTIPFLHKHIPFTSGARCYSEAIALPYFRFPGYAEISRNDLIVFHYPIDDLFPVDHRTYYIKRCIALPGEKIQIKNDEIYINDSIIEDVEGLSQPYRIKTPLDLRNVADSLNITEGGRIHDKNTWELTLTEEMVKVFSDTLKIENIERIRLKENEKDENIFSENSDDKWNVLLLRVARWGGGFRYRLKLSSRYGGVN
jgi:signal peptidase I